MRFKDQLREHASPFTLGHLDDPRLKKPRMAKGAMMLFTTEDGRTAMITRDSIDSGLVAAANIGVIDGDKMDDGENPDVAALALAKPEGSA